MLFFWVLEFVVVLRVVVSFFGLNFINLFLILLLSKLSVLVFVCCFIIEGLVDVVLMVVDVLDVVLKCFIVVVKVLVFKLLNVLFILLWWILILLLWIFCFFWFGIYLKCLYIVWIGNVVVLDVIYRKIIVNII